MEKTKKVTYTCPECRHRWRRTIRIYEGALWNNDDEQERRCTAHNLLRAANVHVAAAFKLRRQAAAILDARKYRKTLTQTPK